MVFSYPVSGAQPFCFLMLTLRKGNVKRHLSFPRPVRAVKCGRGPAEIVCQCVLSDVGSSTRFTLRAAFDKFPGSISVAFPPLFTFCDGRPGAGWRKRHATQGVVCERCSAGAAYRESRRGCMTARNMAAARTRQG